MCISSLKSKLAKGAVDKALEVASKLPVMENVKNLWDDLSDEDKDKIINNIVPYLKKGAAAVVTLSKGILSAETASIPLVAVPVVASISGVYIARSFDKYMSSYAQKIDRIFEYLDNEKKAKLIAIEKSLDDTVDLFHSFNQKQIDARLNDNTSSIRELGQLLESYKLQLRSIMEHPTKEADTTTYSYLISIEKAIYLYCIAHMLDVCLSGNKEMIGKYSEKLDAYIRGYYEEVHDIVSKIYEGSKNYFDSRRVPGSIKKDHYHPDKEYQEYLNAFDQSTYIRYLEGSNDTYKQLTAPVKVYISQDNVYVVEDVK